jgi:histone H3/H4
MMAIKKPTRPTVFKPQAPTPPAPPELTRKSTLEIYLKTLSDKRVGVDAVDVFLARLNDLGLKVVQSATRSAEAAGRNTLMGKDIEASFKTLVGGADLDGIFQNIHNLSAKETADLSQKIQDFLKQT